MPFETKSEQFAKLFIYWSVAYDTKLKKSKKTIKFVVDKMRKQVKEGKGSVNHLFLNSIYRLGWCVSIFNSAVI